MNIKRTKAFSASILGMLSNVGQIFINGTLVFGLAIIMLVAFGIEDGSSGGEAPAWVELIPMLLVFIVVLVLAIINVVSAVLNIINLTFVNGSFEKFRKKKKVVVASIVFGFIAMIGGAGLAGFIRFGTLETTLVSSFYILSSVLLLISNILLIVDLKQEKKRLVQYEQTNIESSIEREDEQNAEIKIESTTENNGEVKESERMPKETKKED